MRETALVTGACGFVGSHMVEHLLRKGYRVLATDHPRAGRERLPQGADFIPADLSLPSDLEPLGAFEFGRVFHIAAVFDYTASWETLLRVNCGGTQNLLEFLAGRKGAPKSIVVWSSGSVYGRRFRKEPLKESETPDPVNPYERSKWKQEEIALRAYFSQGMPIILVRPSAIYGPGSRYGLAVPIFMIRRGLLRFIPGDGQVRGSFIHVEDVAAAAEFLSSRPEAIGETFNLSDDSGMKIEEALLYAASLLGVRFFRVHIPLAPIRWAARLDQGFSRWLGRRPILERDLIDYMGRDFWMDNSKLKSLGYRLRYPDLRSGLPGTVAWYKEQGWI